MRREYGHIVISSDSLRKINRLNEAFSDLHDLIEELLPSTRERALAITNLEQSSMWTSRSLIVHDHDSTARVTD